MKERVLLTNGQLRKTLSVARSLGKRNIEVFSAEETRMNPTGFSKYCRKNLIYPSPVHHPEAFLEWLDRTITAYGIDILFPMDDAAMSLIIKNRDSLSKKVQFCVPPTEQYELAADKWQSVQLASRSGLNCPNTVLPRNLSELEGAVKEVGYPVLVKARNGSGSRGIRVANNRGELVTAYKEVHATYPNPILQQKIPTGPRFDVCLLFDRKSKLIASFAQKELRHFPVEMGPSTVQQSIHLPELVSKCTKMFEAIGWTGIAEVEFMLDETTGEYLFMEINPRFWNSLELAVHCGIDFPYYLFRIAKDINPRQHTVYKEGVYCRWLLPGDILHLLANKNRRDLSPPFWGSASCKLHDDILSWNDPMPLAGFLAACIRYSIDPEMWKFFFKR